MIGDSGPPPAESWDEATDLRRFWWVVPPVLFVALTTGVMLVLEIFAPTFDGRLTTEQTFTRDFTSGEPVRVVVNVPRGSITVEPRDTDTVSVEIKKSARSASEDLAQEALDVLHHHVTATPDGIELLFFYTQEEPRFATADVTVVVPLRAVVDVETLAGDIVMKTADEGNYRAGTANGDIEIDLEASNAAHIAVAAKAFVANFSVAKQEQTGSYEVYRTAPQSAARLFFDLRAPNGSVILESR